MKSVLAVMAQIGLSASNYAVFVIMARLLVDPEYVAFSTAVGLNMLAYALAEAGVSYVAPKALSQRPDKNGARLAGAYIGISASLYAGTMIVGYGVWNTFAAEPLQWTWVCAYAAFFAPALFVPAWLICWSIDRVTLAGVLALRCLIVVGVALAPTSWSLLLAGLAFAALVVWVLVRGNRPRPVVAWPDGAAIKTALQDLRQVFVARTVSYAAYALLPLLVGVFRGNSAAAAYVTAERLKSLYATLFQPLIQSMYLWQFQGSATVRQKSLASTTLQLLNLLVCAAALALAQAGALDILGVRFTAAAQSALVWLAAGASVAGACLLLLHVFPAGNFALFRKAAWVQMAAFGLVGLWLLQTPDQPATWLLLGGEAALLLALLVLMLLHRTKSAQPPPT